MKFEDFDQRMRRFEESLDQTSPVGWYTVVRLDGRGFTKLVKRIGFDRPFDLSFHQAMKLVCEDLMQTGIRMSLCYTQSDEISLLIQDDYAFSNKTRKLNSILAGEASASLSLLFKTKAVFDSRVCPLPMAGDVVDYFRWRMEDARRNALSTACYWYLRGTGMTSRNVERYMHGMSTAEKEQLLAETEIGFEPEWMRLGAMLTWTDVEHYGLDPRTGITKETTRRRLAWLEEVPVGDAMGPFIRERLNERLGLREES